MLKLRDSAESGARFRAILDSILKEGTDIERPSEAIKIFYKVSCIFFLTGNCHVLYSIVRFY